MAFLTRPEIQQNKRGEGKKSVSAIRRSKHFFPAMAEFQSNVLFKLLNLVPNGRKEEGGRWEFGTKEEKYVYLMIWSTSQLPWTHKIWLLQECSQDFSKGGGVSHHIEDCYVNLHVMFFVTKMTYKRGVRGTPGTTLHIPLYLFSYNMARHWLKLKSKIWCLIKLLPLNW